MVANSGCVRRRYCHSFVKRDSNCSWWLSEAVACAVACNLGSEPTPTAATRPTIDRARTSINHPPGFGFREERLDGFLIYLPINCVPLVNDFVQWRECQWLRLPYCMEQQRLLGIGLNPGCGRCRVGHNVRHFIQIA